MSSLIEMVTYEQAGFPVELLNEQDWAKAIRNRRLARGTEVVVYREGASARCLAAAEVPELRSLFDELDPASRPESLGTDTIPAPVAPEPGAVPSIVDGPLQEHEAHRVWGSDEPGSETDSGETHDFLGPQAESPDEGEARLDMSVGVVATVVVLIFVVLIFVAFCSANDRLPGAPENVPRKQTYSVTEPANVREAATTEGRRVRTLRPGTILVGTTADDALGRTWLRITDGENAGLYVWTGNLEVTGAAEGGGDPVP